MNYFVTGFRIALLQRLRSIRGWIILLLLPALVLTVKLCLPEEEISAPVQVGVALPEKGAEDFRELLEARSGTVLTFIEADEEAIDRHVAAGKWDCGLILAEDFEERLEDMDTDRLITVKISAGSTVYPLVKETVSACMAFLIAPDIARDYLTDSGILNEEDLKERSGQLEAVIGESERVLVTMKTVDGRDLDQLELADSGITVLLRWLVSAVLLVWMLLCAADLGRWQTSGAVKRLMPLRSATCLLTAKVSADGLLAAVAGFAALLLLGDGLGGCAAVASYVVFWCALAVLIAHFAALWQSLPVWPPFAVVVSLLLSSALVDMGMVVPELAAVSRVAPVSRFLAICNGTESGVWWLMGGSAVLFCMSFGIDAIRKRRR